MGKPLKAIISGAGIAGPSIAFYLKMLNIETTIYEARPDPAERAGIFMSITPNGLNALSNIISLQDLKKEYTPAKMEFFNSVNKHVGTLETAGQATDFGAEAIQVKKSSLIKLLRETAIAKGATVEYGKQTKSIEQTKGGVNVLFEDGSSAEADFLIGCDGVHSVTRHCIFPKAPAPEYTGLLSGLAYAKLPEVDELFGSIRMIFGRKALFSYAISNKGEIWWTNNLRQPEKPPNLKATLAERQDLRNQLLQLHKGDPYPVADIVKATEEFQMHPIYDSPSLDKWYDRSVCLTGDAAHATAPNLGQGASLALEDAIVLATCIRDIHPIEKAFQRFQSLRQDRVQKLIRQARRIGSSKKVPNRLQRWFRDMFIPAFVKKESKLNWVYSYKVDWKEKIR